MIYFLQDISAIIINILYIGPMAQNTMYSFLKQALNWLSFKPGIIFVHLLSCIWFFATSWTAVCQAFLSFTNSWSLLKFLSIESMIPSNHLILCHPLLLLPSIFSSIGSFPRSHFSASSGQSIGASASTSILPMNIQGWFPLGLSGLISSLSKWLSRAFSSTTVQKHHFFRTQPSLWSNLTSIHDYWKNHSFD